MLLQDDADAVAPAGLRLIVRTDGAARGNPGPASLGARPRRRGRGRIGAAPTPPWLRSRSTWAYRTEQCGGIHGSSARGRACRGAGSKRGGHAPRLEADRRAAPRPLAGEGRQTDPLHAEARSALGPLRKVDATHVPRAQNKQADAALQRGDRSGPGRRAAVCGGFDPRRALRSPPAPRSSWGA